MPYADPEKKAAWMREYEKRRIRIRAGGIQFHLGALPTAEAAQHVRELIKEAPDGRHVS